jgi:hypothetical protein
MTSDSQRRAHPRFRLWVPVRISTDLLDLEGEAELCGEAANLAEGGLYVRSEYLEPPGTAVRVLVDLPDGQVVELTGKVAWSSEQPPRGPGMGIELDEASRSASLVERVLKATSTA